MGYLKADQATIEYLQAFARECEDLRIAQLADMTWRAMDLRLRGRLLMARAIEKAIDQFFPLLPESVRV